MQIGTLLGSEERPWKLLLQNTLQFLIYLKTQHARTHEISTPAAEALSVGYIQPWTIQFCSELWVTNRITSVLCKTFETNADFHY